MAFFKIGQEIGVKLPPKAQAQLMSIRKLFDKILNHKIDSVRTMLLEGSNVNARKPVMDITPLIIAAENSLVHIVDMLKSELAALGLSAECPDVSKILEITGMLIRRQADIMELLLQHGADVNAKNGYGFTPLYVATGVDLLPIIQDLSDNWPGIEWKRQFDVSILKVFDETSIRKVELLLSKGANVNLADNVGATPLYNAVTFETPRIVQLLLDHGVHVNATTVGAETPLYEAVENDTPSIVKLLLEHGADVNVRTRTSLTPLHNAVVYGSTRVVEMLLERGADVKARDLYGRTALQFLVYKTSLGDFKDNLNLLLKYGADLESRNNEGLTLAHMMCEPGPSISDEMLLGMINEVFSHGVNVNAKNHFGRTPYTHLIHLKENHIQHSGGLQNSIFVQHVRKLVTLGVIHMAKKNRSLFFEIMNSSTENLTCLVQKYQLVPIEIEEDDRHYYCKCVEEVGKLRNIKISPNITLADILTVGNPVTLARISQNIVFQDYAQSVDLDSRFPIYAFLMKHQYERGLEMRELCKKCEVSFRIVFSGKLNKDCAQEVLQYLSAVELKNLSEVVNQWNHYVFA